MLPNGEDRKVVNSYGSVHNLRGLEHWTRAAFYRGTGEMERPIHNFWETSGMEKGGDILDMGNYLNVDCGSISFRISSQPTRYNKRSEK
jgi:hypothetical protein